MVGDARQRICPGNGVVHHADRVQGRRLLSVELLWPLLLAVAASAYLLTVLFELQALVRDRLAETQDGGLR
jgi:hypothetical protein